MTDQAKSIEDMLPVEAMADIVRGPSRNTQPYANRLKSADAEMRDSQPYGGRAIGSSVAPPTSPTLGQVLQAYDEILKRLESAKIQADEVRGLTTRATLPNQPKQGSIADLEGGTIFDQLAARAVMISRVAEEIEHNLALSLSAMR